jgi:hypothetical protein
LVEEEGEDEEEDKLWAAMKFLTCRGKEETFSLLMRDVTANLAP